MTHRILIVEDIDLVAEAFSVLLSTEPTFEVVGTVNAGDKVAAAVARHRPDLIMMDVDLPGCSGIEATAALRAAGVTCKVLLLTALPGSGYLHDGLAAGANGYILKSTTGSRLIETISLVLAGRSVVDPELAAEALRSGPNPLTTREQEVLRLLHRGQSTTTIAAALFLSKGTVRNYLSSSMSKLGATGRIEAVNAALRRGWI